MFAWLAKANPALAGRFPIAKTPLLPDPNREATRKDAVICTSANAAIDQLNDGAGGPRGRKRRSYYHYSDEDRAKIAKFACEHGLTATSKRFTKELDHTVAVTTVQTFRDTYLRQVKAGVDPAKIVTKPCRRRGRPFLLPDDLDLHVRKHLLATRSAGGKVNRRITLGTGIGVVRALKPSLLPDHGGSLVLGRAWAESVLERMNFVKRKATKAAKKPPENFTQIKLEYLERVGKVIKDHDIPPSLVLNLDETGLPVVPVSDWTLDE